MLAKLAGRVLYMAHAALQEAGAQAVAGAMMATLPGIDANDPRKTLACFRLYSVVLSSVGTLQVNQQDLLWLLLLSHSRVKSSSRTRKSVVFILRLDWIGTLDV